ncbi:hypothetical protein CLOM_g8577 [Closterium sp. NIES-68]|nr:hypothetical protein CLOM_g8577 [Closterium sp. NIES-68]
MSDEEASRSLSVLKDLNFSFVVTDPKQQDNPIVYVSDAFLELTGYTRKEVLGRNCRFLQGPGTDRGAVVKIRDALRNEASCQVQILNYTKDGTPFWNLFQISPVRMGPKNVLAHYIGVQTCLPARFETSERTTTTLASGESPTSVDKSCAGSVHVAPNDDDIAFKEYESLAKLSAELALEKWGSFCESLQIPEAAQRSAGPQAAGSLVDSVSQLPGALLTSLARIHQSIVLVDATNSDYPIVYASKPFLSMTGYSWPEVVGRNCRFLQGPETNADDVQQIRDAIQGSRSCSVQILNYRKDGTKFWNLLHVSPVRSFDGKIHFYCGVLMEVPANAHPFTQTNASQHLGAVGAVRIAVRSQQCKSS